MMRPARMIPLSAYDKPLDVTAYGLTGSVVMSISGLLYYDKLHIRLACHPVFLTRSLGTNANTGFLCSSLLALSRVLSPLLYLLAHDGNDRPIWGKCSSLPIRLSGPPVQSLEAIVSNLSTVVDVARLLNSYSSTLS